MMQQPFCPAAGKRRHPPDGRLYPGPGPGIGLGMSGDWVLAGLSGAPLGVLMRKSGLDPAQCSGIILLPISINGLFCFRLR